MREKWGSGCHLPSGAPALPTANRHLGLAIPVAVMSQKPCERGTPVDRDKQQLPSAYAQVHTLENKEFLGYQR